MRCFLAMAANVAFAALAAFGLADVFAVHGWTPIYCECAGLIGGGLAGAASCL
jgi:hypothetical protein